MQTQRVLSFQIVLTLFCSFDRCEDGRTVYLKDGFWGGLNKRGDLVPFFFLSIPVLQLYKHAWIARMFI